MNEETLRYLGLRDEEIKTFISLLENGQQTAGALARKTGLSRPSLYGFIYKLKNSGLVQESQKNGVKVFSPCPKEILEKLFEEKIVEFQKGKESVAKLYTEIVAGSVFVNPKFQLFEGKEGLKHVLKDILLYHDIETKAYWPVKSMVSILSEAFFQDLNKERVKQKIHTKVIWPESQTLDTQQYPYLKSGTTLLRTVRIAPKDVSFSMGYWIYGNKAAFISSQKENFGFIIESKELVELLSSQFEVIWNLSKPLKNK
jgi:sugar-specific transcriptional regulator TrmB